MTAVGRSAGPGGRSDATGRSGRLFGRRFLAVGRLRLPSYVVLLEVGCVVGTFVGAWAATADDLDATRFVVATAVLLVPALVGSRAWYVLGHLDEYRRDPARWWRRSEGGSALYGGLLLSALVGVPVLAGLHLPYWRFWDASIVTMLVGLVPTRLGCAMNGCCAGRPTEGRLGVWMPDVRGRWARRHPSPLWEAGLALAILVVVAVVAATAGPGEPFAGARFLAVVGAYAAGRVALGSTREAGRRAARANVAVSLAILVAVGVALAVGASA